MFQKLKNIFQKVFNNETETNPVVERSKVQREELITDKTENFEQSQIEITSEPVIKQIKRSIKYRK